MRHRWSARAAAGDEADAAAVAFGYEVGFRAHGVDGVDDDIGLRVEQALRRRYGVEGHEGFNADGGIDELESLGHGLHLHAAIVALYGVNLAVGVGDAQVIHILQDDGADTAAG